MSYFALGNALPLPFNLFKRKHALKSFFKHRFFHLIVKKLFRPTAWPTLSNPFRETFFRPLPSHTQYYYVINAAHTKGFASLDFFLFRRFPPTLRKLNTALLYTKLRLYAAPI